MQMLLFKIASLQNTAYHQRFLSMFPALLRIPLNDINLNFNKLPPSGVMPNE